MTNRKLFTFALLFTLIFALISTGLVTAQGTDDIKEYSIAVVPQADGTLMNTYTINWCVISNSAGPLTWINIGMPNDTYEVVSFSGDVTKVYADNNDFIYQIRADLPREVNAGDCVTFSFLIHQSAMAYPNTDTNEITYQFTPGWFDEVPVDHLLITWQLPTDPTQVKSFDPTPKSQTDTLASWEAILEPTDRYPVGVVYDKAAFPNFNADVAVSQSPAPTSSTSATGSSDNTPVAATTPDAGFILPIVLSPCVCAVIIVVFIIFIVISSLFSGGRSYRGGSTFGGYHGGGGFLGGLGGGLGGGGASIPNRSGGGSGLFGGRGSSCACVSACACACAGGGGGRAGCSRKGFDVSGLFLTDAKRETK